MNQVDRALKDIIGQVGDAAARIRQLEKSWFASVKIIDSPEYPATGKTGDVVVNKYDNTIKMYANGNWVLLSYGAGDIPYPPENVSAGVSSIGYEIRWSKPSNGSDAVKEYVIYSDDNIFGSSKSEIGRTTNTSINIPFSGDAYFWVGSVGYTDLISTLVETGLVLGNTTPPVTYWVNAVEFGGYQLKWEPVSTAVSYEVEGAQNGDEDNTLKTVWAGTALFTPVIKETGINTFRIRSVAGDGTTSDWTEWTTDNQVPPQPKYRMINGFGQISVVISNDDTSHSSPGFSHYRLRRADDLGGTTNVVTIDDNISFEEFPYTIEQNEGTSYYYELIAYDWANNPSNFLGDWKLGESYVTLAWTSHEYTTTGHYMMWYHYNPALVDHFEIYKNTTQDISGATLVDDNVSGTSYTIPYDLSNFYFGIKAVYKNATETRYYWSDLYNPTVTTPTNVTADLSEVGGWVVSWDDVDKAIKYEVQGNTAAQEAGATLLWSGFANTTPTIKNTNNNFWRVRAVGYANNSTWSSWYTDSNPPPKPSIITWDTPGYAHISIASDDTSHVSVGFSHYNIQSADSAAGANLTSIATGISFSNFPFEIQQETLVDKWYRIIPYDIAGNQGTPSDWTYTIVTSSENGFKDYFDNYGGYDSSDLESLYWLSLATMEPDEEWHATYAGASAPVADTTIFIEGSQSLEPQRDTFYIAGMTLLKSLDLSVENRFTDDDYVVLSAYTKSSTGETMDMKFHLFGPGLLTTYGIGPTDSGFTSPTFTIPANKWTFLKIKKSDFTPVNSPSWSGIERIIITASSTPGTYSFPPTAKLKIDDLRIVKADPDDPTTFNDTGTHWNFNCYTIGTESVWHIYPGYRPGEPDKAFTLGCINGPYEYHIAHVDGLDVRYGTFQAAMYLKSSPYDGGGGIAFFISDATPSNWTMYTVDTYADLVRLHRWNNGTATLLASVTKSISANDILWIGVDVREFYSDAGRIKVYLSDVEGKLIQAKYLVISHKDSSPLTGGGTAGVIAQSANIRYVNFSAGSPAHAELADIARALDGPIVYGVTDRLWLRDSSGTLQKSTDGITYSDVTSASTDIAADTHAATSKATPVDADELPLVDSGASWVLKKLTWANLKATLKTYFDTLYQAAGSYLTTATTFGGDVSGTYNNLQVANDSHTHATQYLGLTAKAADSEKLDNLDSSQFLRSDTLDYLDRSGRTGIPVNWWNYGTGDASTVLWDFSKNLEYNFRAYSAPNEYGFGGWLESEFVTADSPAASGYVLQTSGYRVINSDYIEVKPGETIYGEMHYKYISGSGGTIYFGIERFDKDKMPIGSNTGCIYFVASNHSGLNSTWQTLTASTVIPTTHTPYNGSDGGGVHYIRVRILLNYSGGGATRQYSGFKLWRAAEAALKWETPRNLSLTGDVGGSTTGVDGSGNISVSTTVGQLRGRPIAATAPTDNQVLAYDADFNQWNPVTVSALVESRIVGEIMMWPSNTPPSGWLLCDGSPVSLANHNALYTFLINAGSPFGQSMLFEPYLPDLRGRFPLGKDNMGGTSANRVTNAQADSVGGSGGAESHTLTTGEMPSHNHTEAVGESGGAAGVAKDTTASGNTAVYNTTGYTGGGAAHNNMPPYLTINYVMFAGA